MAKKKRHSPLHLFFETIYGVLTPEKSEQALKTTKAYRSFRAKFSAERSWVEVLADDITDYFGSIRFVLLQVIVIVAWVVINLGLIPRLEPFDPYPFGLLTAIMTLEAMFLAIFVLMTQKRTNQIDDLRSEIDFQVNMQAEQEVTKMMTMVNDIHRHLGLAKKIDRELESMMRKLDPEDLEAIIKAEAVKDEKKKDT